MSDLNVLLEEKADWHRAIAFDSQKKVIASKNCNASEEEIE